MSGLFAVLVGFAVGFGLCVLGAGWVLGMILYRARVAVDEVDADSWEQVPDEIEHIVREAERATAG